MRTIWPCDRGSATQPGRSCHIRNASLPKRLLDDRHIETIVLVGAWPGYRDATSTKEHPTYANIARETRTFANTLAASGKTVVIVGPAPPQKSHVGIAYGRAAAGRPASLATARADLAPAYVEAARAFSSLEATDNIVIVQSQTALCDARQCYAALDGAPLYYDTGHLSHHGAVRVGRLIDAALRRQTASRAQSAAP